MVKLGKLQTTLVAEGVRQEINGKFSILGFFGVSPLVAIYLPEYPTQTTLAFAFICAPSQEEGEISVEMQIEGPDGTIIFPRQPIREQRSTRHGMAHSTAVALTIVGLPVQSEGVMKATLWTHDAFHSESKVEFRKGVFKDGILQPLPD